MSTSKQTDQPARVPGDAEAPPQGALKRVVEKAVQKTDPTEPVQSARNETDEH